MVMNLKVQMAPEAFGQFFLMTEPTDFGSQLQRVVSGVFIEQKAVLAPGITSKELRKRIEQVLELLRAHEGSLFTVQETGLVLQPRSFEAFLEAEHQLLIMCLFLQYASDTKESDSANSDVESTSIGDFEVVKDCVNVKIIEEWITKMAAALNESKVSCAGTSGVMSQITGTKHVKVQIFLLALVLFVSGHGRVDCANVGDIIRSYSREELFVVLGKVLPRCYDANLYFAYFKPLMTDFIAQILTSDQERLKLLLSTLEKRYDEPMKTNTFPVRFSSILFELGWSQNSLDWCCEQIPTRATLSDDSPFELIERILKLWYLLDTSRVFTIDDFSLQIYVFSDDVMVYYQHLMRLFFILNRMREINDSEEVWESVLSSQDYSQFLDSFVLVYTEMHARFTHLCRVLNRNYEIIEIESDSETGAVERKTSLDPEIGAKLRELCLYMTCPLAAMDVRLRLKIYYEMAPVLFDEETERFIFSLPLKRILPALDFLSSDREYFAEHIADMYSCLDRHFCQFHPLKKSQIRYDDHALPPAYSNFAKTPPMYTALHIPSYHQGIQFNAAPGVGSSSANNPSRPTVNPMQHMTIPDPYENPAPYRISRNVKLMIALCLFLSRRSTLSFDKAD